MIETQKIYYGSHPIEDVRFGKDKVILNYKLEPIQSNLIRWYDADNPGTDTGNGWLDLTATRNGTLTPTTSFTYTSTPPANFEYSGASSNRIVMADSGANPFAGASTQPHTIVAWINVDKIGDNVISFTGEDAGANGSKISFRTIDNGSSQNILRVETRGNSYNSSTLGVLSTGTWYMVAYTIDGTNQTDIEMWLNTEKDDGVTGSNTLSLASTAFQAGNQSPTISAQSFDGKMSVFLAYDKKLTDEEIYHTFNLYKGRYGY